MRIESITSLADDRLRAFTSLTDVALRRLLEPEMGLYLAESLKVISRALAAGHKPHSVLTLAEWLPQLETVLADHPETVVFVGEQQLLAQLTGFNLHRGAIAAMERPDPLDAAALLATSKRVVVLEDLADHTNVGAIFRSVAALGADAVLLTPACADPLYRRAVRVSMGAVLQVPWARLPHWRTAGPLIRDLEFALVAMALRDDAIELKDFVQQKHERLALLFGTEGEGLSKRALAAATHCVTIPMQHGVDSLNVATAAAVTLWAVNNVGAA